MRCDGDDSAPARQLRTPRNGKTAKRLQYHRFSAWTMSLAKATAFHAYRFRGAIPTWINERPSSPIIFDEGCCNDARLRSRSQSQSFNADITGQISSHICRCWLNAYHVSIIWGPLSALFVELLNSQAPSGSWPFVCLKAVPSLPQPSRAHYFLHTATVTRSLAKRGHANHREYC